MQETEINIRTATRGVKMTPSFNILFVNFLFPNFLGQNFPTFHIFSLPSDLLTVTDLDWKIFRLTQGYQTAKTVRQVENDRKNV